MGSSIHVSLFTLSIMLFLKSNSVNGNLNKFHTCIQMRDYSTSRMFLFKPFSVTLDSIRLPDIWLHIYLLTEMSDNQIHQSVKAESNFLKYAMKNTLSYTGQKIYECAITSPKSSIVQHHWEKELLSDEWHLGPGIFTFRFYHQRKALWIPH